MRKFIGITCVLLGIMCILGAIGFLGYNSVENIHAEEFAKDLLIDVQNIINEPSKELPLHDDTLSISDNTEIISPEMATVNVDGYDCIGILSIPVLDLELPVLADWSYSKLKKAPCHYYGSYYDKDFVIAAHNYRSHFGRLSELQTGDVIIFTDVNKVEHFYEVVLLETLYMNATSEMITSGFDLSLYTCTLGGSSRVTVRCNSIVDD